jgi:hypothetical protein
MNPNQQLQDQVNKLQNDLEALTKIFYLNNFSSHQDFNKSSAFNYRLKIPHYAAAPTVNDVGEIIEVGGKLYISTAINTWTLVGTQT